MSACLLLDTFQQYLEMSVIFGFLMCTASAKNGSVGNGNVLLEYFFLWDHSIYLIWHSWDWRGAELLYIPFIKHYFYQSKFLGVIFSLCFFIM
jgi:hypothetical protein